MLYAMPHMPCEMSDSDFMSSNDSSFLSLDDSNSSHSSCTYSYGKQSQQKTEGDVSLESIKLADANGAKKNSFKVVSSKL